MNESNNATDHTLRLLKQLRDDFAHFRTKHDADMDSIRRELGEIRKDHHELSTSQRGFHADVAELRARDTERARQIDAIRGQ